MSITQTKLTAQFAEEIAAAVFDEVIGVPFAYQNDECTDLAGAFNLWDGKRSRPYNLRVWKERSEGGEGVLTATVSINSQTVATMDFFSDTDAERVGRVLRARCHVDI